MADIEDRRWQITFVNDKSFKEFLRQRVIVLIAVTIH